MFSFTTSTASSVGDLTGAAATLLPFPPGTDGSAAMSHIPAQFAAVFCTMSGAAATATIAFYLVERTGNSGYERIARFSASVAANAFRSPVAGGATSDYLADTTFGTGNHKVDLMGYGQKISTSTTSRGVNLTWYVAVEVLSAGSITISIADTRAL